MLDTFKENFDEIRQHELHKKEKQRYLRRKHNKHADDGSDEIEGGDIFVGDHYQLGKNGKMIKNLRDSFKISSKHRALGENIMDDGERKKYKSRNHFDEPEMTLKTWQKLFRAHSEGLHFNNVEAFELLKNTRASDKEENETYDPNNLKFDENGILIKNFGFEKVEDNVKMEKLIDESKLSEDFTTTEKFILDWQTVILGIAVSSCIVFFLVAAIYSVQHAKHWKKLRNYFDAGTC